MAKPIPIEKERKIAENDFIVSKTDLTGKLTYCNQIFIDLSGYTESEILGKPHSLIRHPDMPKIVFKLLWDRIKSKEEIFAYVKNMSKDGGYYWVLANVTVSTDANGNPIGYYSVRRKPNEKALKVIKELYSDLLNKEKSGGMEASKAHLEKILKEKDISYDELIINLQKS